jgi:hypothetical protein
MTTILRHDGLENLASEHRDDAVLFHLIDVSLHCGPDVSIPITYWASFWLQRRVAFHHYALVVKIKGYKSLCHGHEDAHHPDHNL